MSSDAPIRGRGTRTVLCKIDNYEEVGPVKVHVYTVPMEMGKNGEEVCEPFWLDGAESFPITLMKDHEFPITIRAYRYPTPISRHINKETKKIVEPLDKSTWSTVMLLMGSANCAARGICIHEEKGQEPCRPAVELMAGDIEHNKEPWVLRVDGKPVPESKLAKARVDEKVEDAGITERLRANQMVGRGLQPVSVSLSPVAPNPANKTAAQEA